MWVVAIGDGPAGFDVGVLLAYSVAVDVAILDVDGVSRPGDDPLNEPDAGLLMYRHSTQKVLIGGMRDRAAIPLLGCFGRVEDHDVADSRCT